MLLYGSKLPENPTFAPSLDSEVENEDAAAGLWNATRDLQLYRDNANAEDMAIGEAYERRNKAIFEATGVQLENPRRGFSDADLREGSRALDAGGDPWDVMQRREAEWQVKAAELARERPEFAGVIASDRPIVEDARGIARAAETGFAAAQQRAAGLGTASQLGNTLGGGIAGMLRDPLQVGTLFVGGGIAAPAKTVIGRVLQTVFAEAAVNAGVEAGVQAAGQEWRRSAGVESGVGPALEQVGLAALFGGGFGGLLQGGAEVFRLTGKAPPAGALERLAAGETEAGDIAGIAQALDVPLDADTERMLQLAAEQSLLDAEAFGPPPAGLSDIDAEKIAAEAVRAIETPGRFDAQDRAERVDRIVNAESPLGQPPKKPVTLMQFLASRDVGGIADEGGALASMGLSKKFVPGGGPLVRAKGKSLDYAREAAAEAGYLDDLYGDPQTAIARSTPDDLLRLIEREAGGEPIFSPRNDGGRIFEWLEFEQRQRAQTAYRRLVEEVDSAVAELGVEAIDDRLLIRAAELVDDETDAVAALERALDEDYRSYSDATFERGEAGHDDSDIPFFENTAAGADAGRAAGEARTDGDGPAGPGGAAAPGERLPDAGGAENPAAAGRQPLRPAGSTPEPGTPEAGEIAELALTEATPAGEQTLIDGVKPVSTKEKLEAQAAKPLRGGDKAPPEGGLFDEGARQQIDMWDAMPAAKEADGTVRHVTHAELIEDADRDEFFSDLIASCKD